MPEARHGATGKGELGAAKPRGADPGGGGMPVSCSAPP